MTDQEIEQKKYDEKMQQLLEELNKMEKNFFVPLNAHPLKKMNDARDHGGKENESEMNLISNSDAYKQWNQQ